MKTCKLNDRGIEVRKIQLLLNSALKPTQKLKMDGHFGLKTQQAVIAFQTSKGLEPDGIVGRNTRYALGLTNPAPSPTQPISNAPLSPWMDIAVAELGVHEDSHPGQHNSRILEYHQTTTLKATTDETPWCSSFVNWVMIQSGRQGKLMQSVARRMC